MNAKLLREKKAQNRQVPAGNSTKKNISPAAQNLIEQYGINPEDLTGTGKGGTITKTDVVRYLEMIGEEE